MKPIRQTILDALAARGWSQSELARRSGVRQNIISRLANGRDITTAVADRLMKALETK